jgi:hypothetical protein
MDSSAGHPPTIQQTSQLNQQLYYPTFDTRDGGMASMLRFLRGCFSGPEWDFLMTKREFRDRAEKAGTVGEAEGHVRSGLELLGEAERQSAGCLSR